jgi:hypothetical protein
VVQLDATGCNVQAVGIRDPSRGDQQRVDR